MIYDLVIIPAEPLPVLWLEFTPARKNPNAVNFDQKEIGEYDFADGKHRKFSRSLKKFPVQDLLIKLKNRLKNTVCP